MKIESNILGVRNRLARYQRAVPVALQRTLAPDPWLAEARELAERVLYAVAKADEWEYVPRFVRTIAAAALPDGFKLTLRNPLPPPSTLESLQAARAAMNPDDLFSNLFRGKVQEFEDLLTEWVATVKDKTQKDAGKTDADIASFISYALISPGGDSMIVRTGKNKGRTVREVFAPHIAEYLAATQKTLPAATSNHWLRLVLTAWRELAVRKLPLVFRAHLKAALTEL